MNILGTLRNLRILSSNGLSEIGIQKMMEGCINIKNLTINESNSAVGPLTFKNMSADLSCLEYLRLRGNANFDDECINLLMGAGTERLKLLDISNSQAITDIGLESLSRRCQNIKCLFMSECTKITDDGLKYIAKSLCELECLDIKECRYITDKTLTYLSEHSKSLTQLNIGGCVEIKGKMIMLEISRTCILKGWRFLFFNQCIIF